MRTKSFEELTERFLQGVQMTMSVNYDDKVSVRRNNRGVTQYRSAAAEIDARYPERLDRFATLLQSDTVKIRVCCAVCMVELMHCSTEQIAAARSVIVHHIENTADAVEQRGFRIWMEKHGLDAN